MLEQIVYVISFPNPPTKGRGNFCGYFKTVLIFYSPSLDGRGVRGRVNDMFLQQIINGLTIGSVYALIAPGYTMVYGILQLINFAHGEIYDRGIYGDHCHWFFVYLGLADISLTPYINTDLIAGNGFTGAMITLSALPTDPCAMRRGSPSLSAPSACLSFCRIMSCLHRVQKTRYFPMI